MVLNAEVRRVSQTSAPKSERRSSRKNSLTGPTLLEMSGKSGGLNGSTQHFPEVYSQESENLKFVVGVDLSAERALFDLTAELLLLGFAKHC